jgi:hydroxyacylglutathione hydrolase
LSMKIFQHFSVVGFCNTYLIGQDGGGPAILIDPGHVDVELIELIEEHHYTIDHVLITHRHDAHVQGLGTLLKIYTPEVHAAAASIYDYHVSEVTDNQTLHLCGFEIDAIHIPGHSLDSMVFKLDRALFTGDVIMSGRIGSTSDIMERELLRKAIRKRLLSLDENLLLFPGHGAPSTLKIEKMFNPELLEIIAATAELIM